ncbi:MAG: hypothetical protein NT157_01465 [Candidatus Micrarchaeota archaeon]|nr:hypothetical protein [Candidatus Micrarchaeota archaeon]
MNMDDESRLAQAFELTYKVIFGECNVKMDELSKYLYKGHYKPEFRKSSLSGKTVALWRDCYRKDSKIISYDEIDFAKSPEPLNLNEIKDIDSVLEAVADRAFYSGNKIFGNSGFVENSDNIVDSFFVKNSQTVTSSKYVAYSSFIRDDSEHVFGSSWLGRGKFLIRMHAGLDVNRCFESRYCVNSSDLFGCYDCIDCYDCMFSFNLRSKRYVIGNIVLPKEKFREIRQKLVSEAREYLGKHKNFPSIIELSASGSVPKNLPIAKSEFEKKPVDMRPIDRAFGTTSALIFGQNIGSIERVAAYLSSRVAKIESVKTIFGEEVSSCNMFFYPSIPKERMVSHENAQKLAELSLETSEVESLEKIFKNLHKIGFFTVNFFSGSNQNNINTVIACDSVNTYQIIDSIQAKNCAYCTMVLESESCFGCYRVIRSSFCINCHNCVKLTCCLEMESCTNCSNSMFCHNCENVRDSMFCFNTKNKQYAIGNVEICRERYMALRKIVLGQLIGRIQKNGGPGFDIYNVPSR